MGLLKETMQAIISIEETISNVSVLWRFETMKKDTNRKNAVKEVPGEPTVDLRFAYPENLGFGGRINAVHLFSGLDETAFSAAIGLTSKQTYELYRGKTVPWPALYRALSRRFNIDETWLATGHLPQTTEEPATPIHLGKIVPLSGYGVGGPYFGDKSEKEQCCAMPLSGYGDAEALRSHINLQHQTRLEVQESLGIQEDSR